MMGLDLGGWGVFIRASSGLYSYIGIVIGCTHYLYLVRLCGMPFSPSSASAPPTKYISWLNKNIGAAVLYLCQWLAIEQLTFSVCWQPDQDRLLLSIIIHSQAPLPSWFIPAVGLYYRLFCDGGAKSFGFSGRRKSLAI